MGVEKSVRFWEHKQSTRQPHHEILMALEMEFEAIHAALEAHGLRPFGHLELRLPGNAFDSEVIIRWERSR